MIKFLFFILTVGFLAQSSGTTTFLKKSVVQIEQSSDDSQKGEEKGKEENKVDQQQFETNPEIGKYCNASFFVFLQNIQSYPSGFSTKPFLPPRRIV